MNIVKENRLIFRRVQDLNILAYIIKAKQLIDGVEVVSTLDRIPNPPSPSPILIRKKVEYAATNKYTIADDVYYNDEFDTAFRINGRQLIDMLVQYNSNRKEFTVLYENYSSNDILEIEYYYDGIEYIHHTGVPTQYAVEYDIDWTSNNIGDHNTLL